MNPLPGDALEQKVNAVARVTGVFVCCFIVGAPVFGAMIATQAGVVAAGIVWHFTEARV